MSQANRKSTSRTRAAKARDASNIDPVFAVIAEVERTWAAFGTVVGEEARLEANLRPIEQRLGVNITTHRPSFRCDIVSSQFETEHDVRRYFADLEKEGPPAVVSFVTKAAWRRNCLKLQATALKQFRKAKRDLKRLQGKHGWTAFERRYEQAGDVADAALEKMCRTTPTTGAGIVALSEWASEHFGDRLEGARWYAAETLLKTIARAAKRLGSSKK